MSVYVLVLGCVYLAGLVVGYGIGRWHGIDMTDRAWTEASKRAEALRAAKEGR
jgi:hypothetical protein